MLSILLALSAQGSPAQTPAEKPAPTVYIPSAKVQLVYPMLLKAEILTDKMKETRKSQEGGVTYLDWAYELPIGHCFVHYTTFSQGSPPKKTLHQLAEGMFTMSKDLSESMTKINPEGDWGKMHAQKFATRQVTERKVGSYPAVLDSHEDQLAGTIRRILAFGDAKEQWVFELSLSATSDSMKKVMDQIVTTIAPMSLTPAQIKAATDYEQEMPGIDLKIAVPGVFGAFERPAIESARPGGKGLVGAMPFAPGFAVDYRYDTYGDQVKTNTSKAVESLVAGFTGVKASKILPQKIGAYEGHVARIDFVDTGTPTYGISAVLTKPGADLILHIQVAKDLGGKERADKIFASLKSK